jgi:peptidoglycan/LPS O-acetylase OafA/YrhL
MNSVTPSSAKSGIRIESLDYLRGMAALAVCYFHLVKGRPEMFSGNFLKEIGSYGNWGAQAFFVISGFVIPYVLCRQPGGLRGFLPFMSRRLRRFYPPFAAAMLLGLVLLAGSSFAASGSPLHFPSLKEMAANITLTAGLLRIPWQSPVYWTLAIELQFYIFIALAFPLLRPSLGARAQAAALVLFCLPPFLFTYTEILFKFLSYFGAGYACMAFMLETRRAARPRWILLGLCSLPATFWIDGVKGCMTVAISVLAILLLQGVRLPALAWLGAVSYSLYLIHEDIGRRIINLGLRWADGFSSQLALFCVAMAACLLAARLFWRWIELPAIQWSHRTPVPPRTPEKET